MKKITTFLLLVIITSMNSFSQDTNLDINFDTDEDLLLLENGNALLLETGDGILIDG